MPPKRKGNDLFCVLENDDGARIMTISDSKHYVGGTGILHFAGTKAAAITLQKSIEGKRVKSSPGKGRWL